MTSETLRAQIERTGRVKMRDLIQVIDMLFYYSHAESDSIAYLSEKDELIALACSQELFEGNMEDFHNLSVELAREDDFFNACQVLEKGLERYAFSVDLLADYLSYGMKCGRESYCSELYNRLSNIKHLWNWRAYQFSIDYLKECQKNNPHPESNEIQVLINEFVSRMPDHEESYLEKAEYLKDIEQPADGESFLSVLEYATSDACPIQRTPKCDLTLADYYYSVGADLNKTLALIERCKRNSVEAQMSVNRNYVYLLSSLCGISSFYDAFGDDISTGIEEESEQWNHVMKVYNDYHVATTGEQDSRVKKCKDIILAFSRETNVPYPYDDLN